MEKIYKALELSIEDSNMARSERRDLKVLLASINGDRTKQALARVKAFQLATEKVNNSKGCEAFEWLEDVVKLIYSKEFQNLLMCRTSI